MATTLRNLIKKTFTNSRLSLRILHDFQSLDKDSFEIFEFRLVENSEIFVAIWRNGFELLLSTWKFRIHILH